MPAAAPCTPATTGLGISRIPMMIGWYRCVSLPYTSGTPPSVRSARFSRRSAPLENALPAPVTSTARTPGSSPTARNAASRSTENWVFHAFRDSGRFSSIFAAPPRRYRLTVSYFWASS